MSIPILNLLSYYKGGFCDLQDSLLKKRLTCTFSVTVQACLNCYCLRASTSGFQAAFPGKSIALHCIICYFPCLYTPHQFPFSAMIPDHHEDGPEAPVDYHGHPDSKDAESHISSQYITEDNSEDPHRGDGYYHGNFRIPGSPQSCRQ